MLYPLTTFCLQIEFAGGIKGFTFGEFEKVWYTFTTIQIAVTTVWKEKREVVVEEL